MTLRKQKLRVGWFIEGKQGVISDMQDAFAQRYRWRA
jgi:hypothetical protein